MLTSPDSNFLNKSANTQIFAPISKHNIKRRSIFVYSMPNILKSSMLNEGWFKRGQTSISLAGPLFASY